MAIKLSGKVNASMEGDRVVAVIDVGPLEIATGECTVRMTYKGVNVVVSKNTEVVHSDYELDDPAIAQKYANKFESDPNARSNRRLSGNRKTGRVSYPANVLGEVFSDIDAVMG